MGVDSFLKMEELRGMKTSTMNPWAAMLVGCKIGLRDQPPTDLARAPVSKERIEEMKMEIGMLPGFSDFVQKNAQLTEDELNKWVYDTYTHFEGKPSVEFGGGELRSSYFTLTPGETTIPGPSTGSAPSVCLSSRPFKRKHEDISTPHPATGRPAKIRIIQESIIHAYYVDDTD